MKTEKGEVDYDFEYDMLYFGALNRNYARSIELDGVVVDFNPQKQVVGLQIFDASKLLKVSKKDLLKIPSWQFTAAVNTGTIEIKLLLKVEIRNQLIEKSQVIKQKLAEKLPECEILCES